MTSKNPVIAAHIAFGCAILLALAACASRQQPASREEIKQAMQGYSDCLRRAAANLDNGAADTASVARAVSDYCTPEYQRLVDLHSQGMNSKAKSMVQQKAEATQLDDATEIVLEGRRQRKAPAQQR
jgi:uncharacterized protein YukE